MRRVLLGLLLVGCGPGPTEDAGVDARAPGAACLDDAVLEICDADGCREELCRGDELCEDATCVPWLEAELFADFEVVRLDGLRAGVRVSPGGFPRRQVESLRFDFGDGRAGHGERLTHDYAEPGRYRIDLEVRLTGFRVLRASHVLELDPPPDAPRFTLTVNAIEPAMNGSTPAPLTDGSTAPLLLHVPPEGFTVDVTLLDGALLDGERPDALSLTSDPDLGGELIDRVTFERGRGRWVVDTPAPLGSLTLTLSDGSSSDALTVEVVDLPPERDPFDRPMVWLFRTDRDLYTTTRSNDGARFTLDAAPGGDGTPDLVEELALLGAQGPDDALNARYLAWFREAIRREVYRVYGVAPDGTPTDDIPLTIFWQGEPGAPDPADFAVDGDFSMMRFGGVMDGFLGFSGVAAYNEERVDDSTMDRGIFTAQLLGILTSTPIATDALNPIKPGVGDPVGTHPADAEVLADGFDPWADHPEDVRARYEDLSNVTRWLALAIAAVTAHEMGHAMGLMPNGLPPMGFFGDATDVAFMGPRTDRFHADLPGLNLMQAGGDYLDVVDEVLTTVELPRTNDLVILAEILALETRLSPLSRAYLQRRLTYEDASAMGGGLAVGCYGPNRLGQ